MPKLTHEQITAVDKALWDIGIKFLDIRIEMTDHAAAVLEEKAGDFSVNLKKYISEHKEELQKNYSQFRMNASVKAVKLLFFNMFSLRFLAILAAVYAIVYADYKYEGAEETSMTFFMISIIGMVLSSIVVGYIQFVRSYKLFSTKERLLPSMLGTVFLTCIPLRTIVDEMEIKIELKLLYYAFVISFYVMIAVTYRFLTKFYKSRYILN